MKFGKITAAAVSAAMAVSMMSVSAFAADTITLDSDYAGNWAQVPAFLRLTFSQLAAM